ncbi:MAG: TIGR02117 family protein [Proteobacteria bacterium]|nr:TIGR02117 family protein [Pseudomonadota bacterium]
MRIIFIVLFPAMILACSSDPQTIDFKGELKHPRNLSIYIVNHGWHTGFIISADAATAALLQLNERFPKKSYFEFGWGDQGFYQAPRITVPLAIHAIFWPSKSVMHVVAFAQDPKQYFKSSEVRMVNISQHQMDSLLLFIRQSFFESESGSWISLNKGIYGDSQFYQGRGDYYLMNNCNKWTAKGLKSIGLDIFPLFKLTASSIMSSVGTNVTDQ